MSKNSFIKRQLLLLWTIPFFILLTYLLGLPIHFLVGLAFGHQIEHSSLGADNGAMVLRGPGQGRDLRVEVDGRIQVLTIQGGSESLNLTLPLQKVQWPVRVNVTAVNASFWATSATGRAISRGFSVRMNNLADTPISLKFLDTLNKPIKFYEFAWRNDDSDDSGSFKINRVRGVQYLEISLSPAGALHPTLFTLDLQEEYWCSTPLLWALMIFSVAGFVKTYKMVTKNDTAFTKLLKAQLHEIKGKDARRSELYSEGDQEGVGRAKE